MEGFEEPLIQNSVSYGFKEAIGTEEEGNLLEEGTKSNGDSCLENVTNIGKEVSVESGLEETEQVLPFNEELIEKPQDELHVQETNFESVGATEEVVETESNIVPLETYQEEKHSLASEINQTLIESDKVLSTINDVQTQESIVDNNIEVTTENVTFETEVLVEQNDVSENNGNITKLEDHDSSNNLLNDLGSNIELSDVLRSDALEPCENNNSSVREEVFNKEELLDILQGNDMEVTSDTVEEDNVVSETGSSDIKLAMEQLQSLKKKKIKVADKKALRKTKSNKNLIGSKSESLIEKKDSVKKSKKESNIIQNATKAEKRSSVGKESQQETKKVKKNDSLASVLDTVIKDWEDEDTGKEEVNNQENKIPEVEIISESANQLDSSDFNSSSLNDSMSKQASEEGQPQRRLSRIIKKKVIFDPDNPDTFTKGKASSKRKEIPIEKSQVDSEKPKLKAEPMDRSPSKSPTSKMMWKKPTPKNSKQHKRLTEVDKLLMDEGAVNMIYQLTPEAPKGRKNMRTKAEFIKKLQSSTPDGSEMKFRERKKETIKEEAEAKKIICGKQRASMSSSVKSSACEDFENHSADDSIIYRRHSSSSYSSTCMSPRRLSDVEGSCANVKDSQAPGNKHENDEGQSSTSLNLFKEDVTNTDIINKSDCLSIKEKLNSKLSQVLSKRKYESTKDEKPVKQKKLLKSVHKENAKVQNTKAVEIENYTNLALKFEQSFALIKIKNNYTSIVEVFKELQEALTVIDNHKDISVTLLMSDCGTLCSVLDIKKLLHEDIDTRASNALEIADSVRVIQMALEQHSKLLCGAVWGDVRGAGLAISSLCDVLLAADTATFALSNHGELPCTSATALHFRSSPLAGCFVKDMLVLNRCVSASEAQQAGLVTRLWPATTDFSQQVVAFARDIAAKPVQNILLRKRLLNLSKNEESRAQFLYSLGLERDLLIEYWTSTEGQDSIRFYLDV